MLLFIAFGSLLVMLLWNSLLPDIFGLKATSYLQAAGVLILAKILFESGSEASPGEKINTRS